MPDRLSGLVLTIACAFLSTAPALAQGDGALETRGMALLDANCSRCHAIGSAGNSPHREAPPFRTLSQRYPIESLAEALAEGLSTGHPDMPEFVFEAGEVGAILAYLKSIQGPASR
jgi:mono/diheme cytochrome c family protein